ncbi:MAG: hypothetical protein RRZ73_05670 [Oscillospiraceae bacterium]
MNRFKQIVSKIAKWFGIPIQTKTEQPKDYSEVSEISWTAAIANRLATLTMLDSDISIKGNNLRAKFIDNFTQDYVDDRMSVAAEVSLGTGDCLIKPYTDGQRIGVDIIANDSFVVCESIGNYIKACIIKADEITIKAQKYERYETQRLRTVNGMSVLFIYQQAYKNGEPVPLSEVDTWANIKPEMYIPNVDRMLFGRCKCPTVNRENINGVNGVKVTYGLDGVMQKAQEAYNRFNAEYESKESFIFADSTLFKPVATQVIKPDGTLSTVLKPTFAAGRDKIFMQVNNSGTGVDSKKLIQEYSPNIRHESLETGLEVNLKMLELLAGLSAGILTKPVTTFATATEMKAGLQNTFAFITKFRKSLEKSTNDLLYAVNVLCNANDITPMGDWTAEFDWSDGYIENMQDRFNQLMQAESIGAIEKAEVRAWTMNEDLETAQSRTKEIAETEPKIEFTGAE